MGAPRGAARRAVAARQNWRCAVCRACLLRVGTFDVDHVVPRSLVPTDDPSALQALCPNCHARKTRAEAAALARTRRAGSSRWRCSGCRQVVATYFAHTCPGLPAPSGESEAATTAEEKKERGGPSSPLSVFC